MLALASGQQLAKGFGVTALKGMQIMNGSGGAVFNIGLGMDQHEAELTQNTPLWFYVFSGAEFGGNRLGKVGSRVVAETFHRVIEASRHSALRDRTFKLSLSPGVTAGRFSMADLLVYAFRCDPKLLNPLG